MVALIAAHIARQIPLVTICLGFSITHQVDRLGTRSIQWDQVMKMEDLWQVLFCEWGVVAIAIAIFFGKLAISWTAGTNPGSQFVCFSSSPV